MTHTPLAAGPTTLRVTYDHLNRLRLRLVFHHEQMRCGWLETRRHFAKRQSDSLEEIAAVTRSIDLVWRTAETIDEAHRAIPSSADE